ncbi:hypothetical protein EG329_001262 [Mollisiaceae sp. DMI_Dod_QoI]|nr:hypothetical protein EG329_001262 [Helotiales sp. DMI_Dod_QoI]
MAPLLGNAYSVGKLCLFGGPWLDGGWLNGSAPFCSIPTRPSPAPTQEYESTREHGSAAQVGRSSGHCWKREKVVGRGSWVVGRVGSDLRKAEVQNFRCAECIIKRTGTTVFTSTSMLTSTSTWTTEVWNAGVEKDVLGAARQVNCFKVAAGRSRLQRSTCVSTEQCCAIAESLAKIILWSTHQI